MAWNRWLCGMNLKSLLHYDIVLEKYGKLVKIRKLAKYGNIGPSSLKRMPATNGLLKKMPTPHGDIVGWCFVYSTMVSFCPKRPWKKIMDLPKMWFREIRPSLGEDQKLSKYGIIGKICITNLREMPAIAHRMTIKILWDCGSLESCIVHPTI